MTAATWTTFWATLITFAGISFSVLAIVVAVRGVQDIRSMLRRMRTNESDTSAS